MTLSLTPLLLHEADVPPRARAALLAASLAPAGEQRPYLEAAARALFYEAHLDCEDARELVGLDIEPDEHEAAFQRGWAASPAVWLAG